MLWNVVYEFFVKYVFGGVLYVDGEYAIYYADYGALLDNRLVPTGTLQSRSAIISADFLGDASSYYSYGNYFSLIATIISMVVIVVLACLFIKKIYNMCAHIIA